MATREHVYTRPLEAPLDTRKRERIVEIVRSKLGSAYRKHDWHPTAPILTITATLVTLIIAEQGEELVVEAEYGWAARMMLTDAHRKQAQEMASQICDEAGL